MSAMWEKAFETSIGTKAGYQKRLTELKTWGKPFVPKENDTNGKWREWAKKIAALENLLA